VPFRKVDAPCKLPLWCRHLAFHGHPTDSRFICDLNVRTSLPIGNAKEKARSCILQKMKSQKPY
jgi:hypothetical protein